MIKSKQSHTVFTAPAAASAPPRRRQPWRRTAVLVAAVAAVMLLASSYHAATSASGATLLLQALAHGATPPPPPRCPAQQAIAPSARPDITEHNVEQIFRSAAFRNLSVSRLAGAVQIPTQDFEDMGRLGEDPRWDTFYDLQRYLEKTFPLLLVAGLFLSPFRFPSQPC